MRTIRKAFLASFLALAVLFLLSSCNLLGSIFNPLLGSWEKSVTSSGVTYTADYTFNYDNTWSETQTAGGTQTDSASGTFTQDTSAKTITLVGTDTYNSNTYSVNLTLTYSINGSVLTLRSTTNWSASLNRK